MADIILPHTITPNTLADATEVQENFEELADKALNKTGDAMEGTLETLAARPTTDATYDLGSATKQYKDLYLSGSVIGPAGVNAFGTIAVSGQTDVVADSGADTLTLVAGTGVTLTTTPASDSVTITASGQTVAGGSAINFASGGIIYDYQSTTGVGNVGTGEDTLYSQAIAANVLSADGAAIEFVLAGTFGATANEKRIRVKFGVTTIFDLGAGYTNNNESWRIHGTIVRTSGTTQICEATINQTTLPGQTDVATASETCSGAITFAVTGEATDNSDVVLKIARLYYSPAALN